MVQLAKKYVGNISAKGLLYAEAIDMIVKGHQMVQAGTEALQHLEGRKAKNSAGYGGTQGGRLVTAPKSKAAKAAKGVNPDVLATLHWVLTKGSATTMELAKAAKCSTSYVRLLFKTDKKVVREGGGNQMRWALRTGSTPKTSRKVKAAETTVAGKVIRRQAKADAADPEQKKDEEKILAILKDAPKLTIGPLMRKLKRSFYPTTRAIKAMLKDGRLKLAEAAAKNGRKLVTWVPA
jgi:hypothetical protein